MGTSWSKGSSWFQGSFASAQKDARNSADGEPCKARSRTVDPRCLASQFVYTRTGSMYFDEDGDLAHEFYEEVRADNSGKTVMERRSTNLRPQGLVYYTNPRLNVNFPIALYSPAEK